MQKLKNYIFLVMNDQLNSLGAKALQVILYLLSLIYGLFIRIILLAYNIGLLKKRNLGLPVISVGNITWGGTGKTPFVIHLAKLLKSKGKNPAILMRGYKISSQGEPDELSILKNNLESLIIIADEDRISAAQKAKTAGADCIILDDGFQQWKIKKGLEIAMINSVKPFGNKYMIPRGSLREPLSSLKRAQIIIFNKADLKNAYYQQAKDKVALINKDALILESRYETTQITDIDDEIQSLDIFNQRSVLLLCAIGEPLYFEKLVQDLGADVAYRLRFRDHHVYTQSDIDEILQQAIKSEVDFIVTTQKDISKLKPYKNRLLEKDLKILTIKVDLKVLNSEKDLMKKIEDVFNS